MRDEQPEVESFYKNQICKLVNECTNLHWLKTIYMYVKRLLS